MGVNHSQYYIRYKKTLECHSKHINIYQGFIFIALNKELTMAIIKKTWFRITNTRGLIKYLMMFKTKLFVFSMLTLLHICTITILTIQTLFD